MQSYTLRRHSDNSGSVNDLLKLVPHILIAVGIAIIVLVVLFVAPPATETRATVAAKTVSVPRSNAVASAIKPALGALSGGERVTITGAQLADVTEVEFNGSSAPIVAQTSAAITVTAPHSLDYTAGDVAVTVYTEGGALDAELTYTYATLTDVDRQMEYAFARWNNYNTAQYGNFNAWGGDCINFVSQTLVARGWATSEEWFNNSQQEWGTAFVYVPGFDEWLTAHPEFGARRLAYSDQGAAKIGDVVMFDWNADGSLDHAQVISDVATRNGDTTISMVGHNIDTNYRTIDYALLQQGGPQSLVYFWSIPA